MYFAGFHKKLKLGLHERRIKERPDAPMNVEHNDVHNFEDVVHPSSLPRFETFKRLCLTARWNPSILFTSPRYRDPKRTREPIARSKASKCQSGEIYRASPKKLARRFFRMASQAAAISAPPK